VENPLSVSLKMQLGRHAVHRVDHAAELRDKERVHDAGGGQREMDGGPYRNDELVDARDALVGVDEQPLPVERDDLHVERLGLPVERLGRIEVMRPDPGDAAEEYDDEQGNGPDDELDAP
jgi:hypothetical protein